MDPVTASLAIATATAASSAAGAMKQNDAIRGSMRSARDGEAIQSGQLRDQAEFEQSLARRRARAAAARIRTTLAAAGRGDDLSAENAQYQALSDGETEAVVIERNRNNNIQRVRSATQAQIQQLRANYQSPFFVIVNSVLSGVGAGLNTANAMNSINGMMGSSTPTTGGGVTTSNPTAFVDRKGEVI
jgi:hypothetical protein